MRLEIKSPQAFSAKVLSTIVADAYRKPLRMIVALRNLNANPRRSPESCSAVVALKLQDIWRNQLSVRCTTKRAVDASSFFLFQQTSKDLLSSVLLDFSSGKKATIFQRSDHEIVQFCLAQASLSTWLLHRWPRRARR